MAFCSECGKEITVAAKYCNSCGQAISKMQPTVSGNDRPSGASAKTGYKFGNSERIAVFIVIGVVLVSLLSFLADVINNSTKQTEKKPDVQSSSGDTKTESGYESCPYGWEMSNPIDANSWYCKDKPIDVRIVRP